MALDHSTAAWLRENRDHRMDALDATGIFSPDRQAFHRARYEFALNYVQNLEVADIASGLGYGCRILKEGGAKIVRGIDASPEAIAYARSEHEVDGITFEVGDATLIPLADGSVDTITSFETIEHIPDTTRLLGEFCRVLKPRGEFIVSSPNDWGLTEHHRHTWSPFEFMAEINAFFEIESVWEQNSDTMENKNREGWRGIHPWSKENEHKAECLIILARKALL